MKEYNLEGFERCLAELGIALSEEQKTQFLQYYALLVEWNSFMNLTAITEFDQVITKHFLDSLSLVKVCDVAQAGRILDVGTGAGFPGIPLKIAFPEVEVVLLDSLNKRVKFLNEVIGQLGLSKITAIHGRAEDFARQKEYREQFDLVVSRAVANLSSLSEYCLPYVKVGGRFVSYKSGKLNEELVAAQKAIHVSKIHSEMASDFFRKLYDKGEFIEKTSMQYYDEEANQFLADRYITGTCPHCGNEHAYGDQCEACGTSLNATDLINPKSAITGNQPVLRETKHWYLPLDKWEPFLRQWILEEHKEWKPNVYGQCKSWLDMGLQPRAVSRDLDWGVPVPVEGAEGKVLYVWFDAPIGYISNTKELLPDKWELYWKDKDTKMVHFIGKDNIVFHCIVFPAMLKAEGSYILPDNVPANEFLNLEGDKISTSRNWAVWLHEYLEEFPGKQDVLRYVLTANAPETKDNDFTWKDFQARNNNELVAILGNFVNRALVLTHKYFDGKVPAAGELTDYDRETLKEFADVKAEVENYLDHYRFRDALKEAMNLARIGNKYLADTEPWKLAKTDMDRAGLSADL